MLEIDQWELEIQLINCIDNTSADNLSRYPPHLNNPDITNPGHRDQIMVHAIDLNIDNSVKTELKNLSILQNTGPRLQAIKEGLTSKSTTARKYIVNNDVQYCKGEKEGQNWKAMMPECLEQKVMKFVHTSSGRLEVTNVTLKLKTRFISEILVENLGSLSQHATSANELNIRIERQFWQKDITSRNVQENRVLSICTAVYQHREETSDTSLYALTCSLNM
jgi:hypothetical protein